MTLDLSCGIFLIIDRNTSTSDFITLVVILRNDKIIVILNTRYRALFIRYFAYLTSIQSKISIIIARSVLLTIAERVSAVKNKWEKVDL